MKNRREFLSTLADDYGVYLMILIVALMIWLLPAQCTDDVNWDVHEGPGPVWHP